MAFCTNCGSPLDPSHKFCTNCGQSNPAFTPVSAPASQPSASGSDPFASPASDAPGYFSGSRDPQPEPSFGSSYGTDPSDPFYGGSGSQYQQQRKKKGLSGGAIALIIIVTVLVALIAVVAVLFMRGKDKKQEEPIFTQPSLPAVTETPGSAPVAPVASADFIERIAGHYEVISLTDGGNTFDRDMLVSAGYGDVSLDFYADGTGIFTMPDSDPTPFTYSENKIYFGLGDVSDFSFADGLVTVTDEDVTFVFAADGSAPAPTPGLTELPPDTDLLPLESDWHGTLTISDYSGNGTLSNGPMEVWGFLGQDSSGKTFFELYEEYGTSGYAILSMYVDVKGDHFVPVIGEDDAWLFNAQLDQRDVEPFTLYYRNGSLTLDSYNYRIQGESCTVSFSVDPY